MNETLVIASIGAGSALLGALIGGSASVVVMWIQQRYQHKREILKIAVETAQKDWKDQFEILEKWTQRGGRKGIAYPLTAYVFYHHRVLQELEKERFNAETVRQIA